MRTRRTRQLDRQGRSFKIRVASLGDLPLQHRMARAIAAAAMPIVVLHSLVPPRCQSTHVTLADSTQDVQSDTGRAEQRERSP